MSDVKKSWKFLLLIATNLLGGCAIFGTTGDNSYDTRFITVQNINLFDQRTPSNLVKRSWKGDWLFRRERLELIDSELRLAKPDIVFFQDMLAKRGSPSESDRNILAKGSLKDYEWNSIKIKNFRDTQEDSFHSVAVGLPVKKYNKHFALHNSWEIGVDGFLTLTLLELDEKPILAFSLQMPAKEKTIDNWYLIAWRRIEQTVEKLRLCKKRIIIAGYMPGRKTSGNFRKMMEALELKDTSEGFCEVASDCYTGNPLNDIFMATSGGKAPAHMDRILVNTSAIVSFSHPILKSSQGPSVHGKSYKIDRLWPTQRFGWAAGLRLPRCTEDYLR